MGLLEVVTSNAGAKVELKGRNKAIDTPTTAAFGPGPVANTDPLNEASVPLEDGAGLQAITNVNVLRADGPRPEVAVDITEVFETSTSGFDQRTDNIKILLSLPEPELCILCKLLAREG